MRQGLLVTADGAVFRGRSVAVGGIRTGEAVFNTSMTGYQEIITDPSYAGQVVVFTAPHVGNYGVTAFDSQSTKVHARSLITRSMSPIASSWRSEQPLADYLVHHDVVALTDIDTRRLTRHIREHGSMPVAVGVDIDEAELAVLAASAPTMKGQDLVSAVTTDVQLLVETDQPRIGHVVAYDFGIKTDMVRSMNALGLDVTVVPASTESEDVMAMQPDAVFLSNGPGDPEPLVGPIAEIKLLLGSVPVFGICLGHQILGLALGARTFKLAFGHHGGNHPVQRVVDGSVEITSQNHGFAIDLSSITDRPLEEQQRVGTVDQPVAPFETPFGAVSETHRNLNDGTNEGIRCHDITAFSVQYHPEAAPGPNDASTIFDDFIDVMRGSSAETK
ncbi:MAG: glutamine-hydrolyzing carbamoyl-phosphate synthase small subunit [Actinomycetia bacterium]|nr:glutamine-hydrolyzing carbamoyl-phosphate synthase small subunit [Actinomycetes bacterium]